MQFFLLKWFQNNSSQSNEEMNWRTHGWSQRHGSEAYVHMSIQKMSSLIHTRRWNEAMVITTAMYKSHLVRPMYVTHSCPRSDWEGRNKARMAWHGIAWCLGCKLQYCVQVPCGCAVRCVHGKDAGRRTPCSDVGACWLWCFEARNQDKAGCLVVPKFVLGGWARPGYRPTNGIACMVNAGGRDGEKKGIQYAFFYYWCSFSQAADCRYMCMGSW